MANEFGVASGSQRQQQVAQCVVLKFKCKFCMSMATPALMFTYDLGS